ncbi:MAG: hypothetical protein AAB339_12515, partial [Elusimicrobiota bacterium]
MKETCLRRKTVYAGSAVDFRAAVFVEKGDRRNDRKGIPAPDRVENGVLGDGRDLEDLGDAVATLQAQLDLKR